MVRDWKKNKKKCHFTKLNEESTIQVTTVPKNVIFRERNQPIDQSNYRPLYPNDGWNHNDDDRDSFIIIISVNFSTNRSWEFRPTNQLLCSSIGSTTNFPKQQCPSPPSDEKPTKITAAVMEKNEGKRVLDPRRPLCIYPRHLYRGFSITSPMTLPKRTPPLLRRRRWWWILHCNPRDLW